MPKVQTPSLRVFINRAPWNELLLLGERAGSGYEGVKYRNWKTHVRGLVVLYTARSRTDEDAMYAECLVPYPDMTLGVDYEEGDFPYTKEKLLQNRGMLVGVAEIIDGSDGGYIYMNGIKRFPDPIPFSPGSGPVNWAKVPLSVIESQLRKIGALRKARKNILA